MLDVVKWFSNSMFFMLQKVDSWDCLAKYSVKVFITILSDLSLQVNYFSCQYKAPWGKKTDVGPLTKGSNLLNAT